MTDEMNDERSPFEVVVAKPEKGGTYPLYGMVTKIVSHNEKEIVLLINAIDDSPGIELTIWPNSTKVDEMLDILKRRSFEPAIFVTTIEELEPFVKGTLPNSNFWKEYSKRCSMKELAAKETVRRIIKNICSDFAEELYYLKEVLNKHKELLPEQEKSIIIKAFDSYCTLAHNIHKDSQRLENLLDGEPNKLDVFVCYSRISYSISLYKEDLKELSLYLQTGSFPKNKNTLH